MEGSCPGERYRVNLRSAPSSLSTAYEAGATIARGGGSSVCDNALHRSSLMTAASQCANNVPMMVMKSATTHHIGRVHVGNLGGMPSLAYGELNSIGLSQYGSCISET